MKLVLIALSAFALVPVATLASDSARKKNFSPPICTQNAAMAKLADEEFQYRLSLITLGRPALMGGDALEGSAARYAANQLPRELSKVMAALANTSTCDKLTEAEKTAAPVTGKTRRAVKTGPR